MWAYALTHFLAIAAVFSFFGLVIASVLLLHFHFQLTPCIKKYSLYYLVLSTALKECPDEDYQIYLASERHFGLCALATVCFAVQVVVFYFSWLAVRHKYGGFTDWATPGR